MRSMWILIIVVLMLGMWQGCGSTKKMVVEVPSEDSMEGINEDFEPTELDEPQVIITPNQTEDEQVDIVSRVMKINETDSVDSSSQVLGFRVQIYGTPDEEIAREIRTEAILKFSEEVYLSYDSPYYKIRVGNCLTRFDAEDLQRQAVEKGFENAWVIRTLVLRNPVKRETEDEEESP